MDVSENNGYGTPKSSILVGDFHYFHHPFWGVSLNFWKHPNIPVTFPKAFIDGIFANWCRASMAFLVTRNAGCVPGSQEPHGFLRFSFILRGLL